MTTDTIEQGCRMLLQTITTASKPSPYRNPLNCAMERLIMELAQLRPPHMPVMPEPEDFERVSGHLVSFAEIVDRYVKAVGEVAKYHSAVTIDLRLFQDQLSGALIGNATVDLRKAAEAIQ